MLLDHSSESGIVCFFFAPMADGVWGPVASRAFKCFFVFFKETFLYFLLFFNFPRFSLLRKDDVREAGWPGHSCAAPVAPATAGGGRPGGGGRG